MAISQNDAKDELRKLRSRTIQIWVPFYAVLAFVCYTMFRSPIVHPFEIGMIFLGFVHYGGMGAARFLRGQRFKISATINYREGTEKTVRNPPDILLYVLRALPWVPFAILFISMPITGNYDVSVSVGAWVLIFGYIPSALVRAITNDFQLYRQFVYGFPVKEASEK